MTTIHRAVLQASGHERRGAWRVIIVFVPIRAYGMFWRAEEIDWFPGRGRHGPDRVGFRLLGRIGKNAPTVRLADFRTQSGIYVLYGDYGPRYVGLTQTERLGYRLKDHLQDEHAGAWDRFSWFGFRPVLKRCDDEGVQLLKRMAGKLPAASPTEAIRELEAVLIAAMGLTNINKTRLPDAEQWEQVRRDEARPYLDKVRQR